MTDYEIEKTLGLGPAAMRVIGFARLRALVAAAQAEGQRIEVDSEKGCDDCPLWDAIFGGCGVGGTPDAEGIPSGPVYTMPLDCPLRKGRVIVERKA